MATTRQARQATPQRWQAALKRALDGNVQVRQLGSTGQWIATSATDETMAYELAVTNGVAHGCSCIAADHGDPVCCHRAMFWHMAGTLDLAPEEEAPAASAMVYHAQTGKWAGRTVEVRMRADGACEIVDVDRGQRLGAPLDLTEILMRLAASGFLPVGMEAPRLAA